VDDHRIVREGLAMVIGNHPDFEVIGLASNGEEAVSLFGDLRPDITLMDLQMPGMPGLEAIHRIRNQDPNARIVVLTMYTGDEDIRRSMVAGATAYVLKDTSSDDLLALLRQVAEGRMPIMPSPNNCRTEGRLTLREIQVLEMISKGLRNKELADVLDISEDTVEAHIKHIFEKLEVHDRTAAVAIALRRGIIHLV